MLVFEPINFINRL